MVVDGSGRFDYVKYDEHSANAQAEAKELFVKLEASIEKLFPGRAKSLALAKLEEVYMWIGKAIRDEQVGHRGAELQEDRTNS